MGQKEVQRVLAPCIAIGTLSARTNAGHYYLLKGTRTNPSMVELSCGVQITSY